MPTLTRRLSVGDMLEAAVRARGDYSKPTILGAARTHKEYMRAKMWEGMASDDVEAMYYAAKAERIASAYIYDAAD